MYSQLHRWIFLNQPKQLLKSFLKAIEFATGGAGDATVAETGTARIATCLAAQTTATMATDGVIRKQGRAPASPTGRETIVAFQRVTSSANTSVSTSFFFAKFSTNFDLKIKIPSFCLLNPLGLSDQYVVHFSFASKIDIPEIFTRSFKN